MSIFDLLDSPEKQRRPEALHPIERSRRWTIDRGVAYLEHAYRESIGTDIETPSAPVQSEPQLMTPEPTPPTIEDYSFDITRATPEQLKKMYDRAEAQAIVYQKDENNIHIPQGTSLK